MRLARLQDDAVARRITSIGPAAPLRPTPSKTGTLLNTSNLDTMLNTPAPDGDGEDAAEWVLVGTLALQIAMVLAATVLAVFKI